MLFIHGRGDEPTKSLNGSGFLLRSFGFDGDAVPKLSAYGANVVMFSWDSKRGRGLYDRSRPLANMDDAQKHLSTVLDAFALAVAARGNAPRPQLTLLAHSMGTIVVQRYVQAQQGFPHPIFDNVILSSSDADNLQSTSWIDPLAAHEPVFITVNQDDRVLGHAADQRREIPDAKPLGLDPGTDRSASANVTYIVVPPAKAHELFSQSDKLRLANAFYATAFVNGDTKRLGVAVPATSNERRLQ